MNELKMTLQEFCDLVSGLEDRPAYIRAGQQAFNLLYVSNPDIADELRGSSFDPFYTDDKLAIFLHKLLTEFVKD